MSKTKKNRKQEPWVGGFSTEVGIVCATNPTTYLIDGEQVSEREFARVTAKVEESRARACREFVTAPILKRLYLAALKPEKIFR